VTDLHWPEAMMLRVPTASAPPWAASVTSDELVGVWHAVVPLRRLLLLLGHQVGAVSYRHPDSGFEWVRIAFDPGGEAGTGIDEAAVVDDADPAGPPLHDGFAWDGPTIALPLAPILDARDGASMAVPLAPATGPPPEAGASWLVAPDGAYLYVGFDDEPVEPESVLVERMRLADVALDACAAAQAGLLAAAMLAAPLGPDSGCGLAWLLDPQFWRDDVETGLRFPSAAARKVEQVGGTARDAILVLRPVLPAVLLEQVADPASPFAPRVAEQVRRRLVDLLRQGSGWYFGEDAELFFTTLATWLEERADEALLPPARVAELKGMPWYGVLVSLAEAGVLTPTALGDVAAAGPLLDPVAATRASRWSVELTVLGTWVFTLRRVRDDDGVILVDEDDDDLALLDPIPQFTWDYVVPEDDAELPTLYLVAAPGVQVEVPLEPPDGWRYEVVRVMDTALVPPWGSAVDPVHLLAPYLLYPGEALESTMTVIFPAEEPGGPPVSDPAAAIDAALAGALPVPAAAAVQVSPTLNGMRLHYPVYQDGSGDPALAVEVSLPGNARFSGDERFAFDVAFYLETLPRETPLPYVSVWATSGVHVAIRKVLFTEDVGAIDVLLPADAWRVDDYTDVPKFGTPLPVDPSAVPRWRDWVPDWDPEGSGDNRLPAARGFELLDVDDVELPFWLTFLVDLPIGFIPVVGDLADVYDLSLMLATGRDHWNRPVTNFDIATQAFFTLVPLVAGAAARGMARELPGVTTAVRADLRAGLGTAPRNLVELTVRQVDDTGQVLTRELVDAEMASASKGWQGMSARARRRASTEIAAFVEDWVGRYGATLRGQFFTLDDLLHPNATGFRIQEVQRAFERWLARLDPAVAGGKSDLELIELFVETGARGRARVILKALIGDVVGAGVRKARLHPKALASWPSRAGVVFRRIPIPQEDLVARLDEVLTEAEALVRARHGGDVAHGPPQWIDCTFLDYSSASVGDAGAYVARIRRLLGVLGDGDPDAVDLAALRRIIGTKKYHPRELAAQLVAGLDIVAHEAGRHGRSIDDFLPPESAATEPIRGIEGFFQKLCTGSAAEHAARLEIGMVANALKEGTPAENLVMGIALPGVVGAESALRQGPDLGRFTNTLVRLEQGKSYALKDILLGDARPDWLGPNKEWLGPEIFVQLWKDLLRLDNVGHQLPHPRTGRAVPVFREVVFRVHGQWYYANQIGRADIGEEMELLEDELIPAFEKQINDFLASPAALTWLPNLPSGLVYTVKVVVLP
jgi:hypothetical protein